MVTMVGGREGTGVGKVIPPRLCAGRPGVVNASHSFEMLVVRCRVHTYGLYGDTLSGSSGLLPFTPTVGNRMPEMFHTMGLSVSSNLKLARSRARMTSVDG